MPEESPTPSPTGDPSKARPAKGGRTREVPRGPRLSRGVVLVMMLVFLVFILAQTLFGPTPRNVPYSLHQLEQTWDEKEQRYVGFDDGLLKGIDLRLHPIDQSSPGNPADATAAAEGEAVAKPAADGQPAETDPEKPGPDERTPAADETGTATTGGAAEQDATGGGLLGLKLGAKRDKWYALQIPAESIERMLPRLSTIKGFDYEEPSTFWPGLLQLMLPLLFFGALIYFIFIRPMRSAGGPGGLLNFGRSKPRRVSKDNIRVKFDDVAGVEEAKEEVSEVIEFLKEPEKFAEVGGRIPRGVLFVGPPGTGKTLLAKAIAGEADVPFFSISGSDFVEMFVGVGASRVRDLFRQAKEDSPCIIFLDEIDAVGRRRGSGMGGGNDEREQTLNAILVEMDGFETDDQVIVIASTNRPDVLDPALLRPGRFDRQVSINLPDVKGRLEILKVHIRNVKCEDTIDLHRVARGTAGFSGAELEALINEAAIRATMAGRKAVNQQDLEESRDKVRFGRQRRTSFLDEKERRLTAYHEAGHALLHILLPDSEPLHKVTIIPMNLPQGQALGVTMNLPEKDRYSAGRKYLEATMQVIFGGRIAEDIYFQDVTTGAGDDFRQATNIARQMVCDWGMSDLGPIRYTTREQHRYLGGEIATPRDFSEATAERIDQAIREIIDRNYKVAEKLLRDNGDKLELIAKGLMKHESLTAEEIDVILQAKDIHAVHHEVEATSLPEDDAPAVRDGQDPPGGPVVAPQPDPKSQL